MLLRAFLVCWLSPSLLIGWVGALILPPLSRTQILTLLVAFAAISSLVWIRYVLPYLRLSHERARVGDTLGTLSAFLIGVIPYEVLRFRVLQYVGILVVSLIAANTLRGPVTEVAGETAGTICWGISTLVVGILIQMTISPRLREIRLEMLFKRLQYNGASSDELSELLCAGLSAITKYEREILWEDVMRQRAWEQ
ncbi:MAG: hypothetical protein WD883_02580 [Candidatus Colwellbacteria bacterium]